MSLSTSPRAPASAVASRDPARWTRGARGWEERPPRVFVTRTGGWPEWLKLRPQLFRHLQVQWHADAAVALDGIAEKLSSPLAIARRASFDQHLGVPIPGLRLFQFVGDLSSVAERGAEMSFCRIPRAAACRGDTGAVSGMSAPKGENFMFSRGSLMRGYSSAARSSSPSTASAGAANNNAVCFPRSFSTPEVGSSNASSCRRASLPPP